MFLLFTVIHSIMNLQNPKNRLRWKWINDKTKVARWNQDYDIRAFRLRGGWSLFADLLDEDPRNGKKLKRSTWFIFATK